MPSCLRSFLEESAEQHSRGGLTRAEALRQARMDFGGVEVVKDSVRDVRVGIDDRQPMAGRARGAAFVVERACVHHDRDHDAGARARRDHRHFRRRVPGDAEAATLREPDRLVSVLEASEFLQGRDLPLSASLYFTYREGANSLEDIGLWSSAGTSVTGIGEPEQVSLLLVTDGTLAVLRVKPLIGRLLTRADDSPGGNAILLAHGYWQRRFGGDAKVLDRTIVVSGRPRTVVGVLPASFRFLNENPDVVGPFGFDRARLTLGQFNYRGVARLKEGVTLEQATADTARLLGDVPHAMAAPPPGADANFLDGAKLRAVVRPLAAEAIGNAGRMLWVLLGTIGLVLLIAVRTSRIFCSCVPKTSP